MDTIVIKLNQPEKGRLLLELLKSLDFISTAEYFDNYVSARRLFDEINRIAATTALAQMNMEEIDQEISDYRHGK